MAILAGIGFGLGVAGRAVGRALIGRAAASNLAPRIIGRRFASSRARFARQGAAFPGLRAFGRTAQTTTRQARLGIRRGLEADEVSAATGVRLGAGAVGGVHRVGRHQFGFPGIGLSVSPYTALGYYGVGHIGVSLFGAQGGPIGAVGGAVGGGLRWAGGVTGLDPVADAGASLKRGSAQAGAQVNERITRLVAELSELVSEARFDVDKGTGPD